MGDHGRLAGRAALDEMGRAVAEMLAKLGDEPPIEEPLPAKQQGVVAERTPELPDLAELDGLLAGAEAGWASWQRRIGELAAGLS